MIVAFQPGGSVKDARVVLKPDELVPDRFNNEQSIVYREDPETHQWILVKGKHQILPPDSPLLSQPKLPESDNFSLTIVSEGDTFEHADIIRMGEENEDEG